ncbi:hypothetical protein FVE85_0887 [Porphyridium purpureum]|uniref:Uncharacterized protein n=1 Tax=Porphyridium purpureum TaxID=35688 RepID=A0A5J4Z1E9_PORPP|nr:hypothetical protein FVE85_0887 [Porphyridium purpureum]|eukprot:POR8784..scf208_2
MTRPAVSSRLAHPTSRASSFELTDHVLGALFGSARNDSNSLLGPVRASPPSLFGEHDDKYVITIEAPSLIAVFTFTLYTGMFCNTLDPTAFFTALPLLNNMGVPLMISTFVTNSSIESCISAKHLELSVDMDNLQEYTQHASEHVSHEGKTQGIHENRKWHAYMG